MIQQIRYMSSFTRSVDEPWPNEYSVPQLGDTVTNDAGNTFIVTAVEYCWPNGRRYPSDIDRIRLIIAQSNG